MDRTVVFMTRIPFMNHHIQDMYVDAISEKYDIQLWDLSNLYGNTELNSSVRIAKKISSIDELDKTIQKVCKEKELVVVSNILNIDLSIIIDIIHKYKIPIVNINKDSLAASLSQRGSLRYLKYLDLKSKCTSIIEHIPIFNNWLSYKRYGGIKYDYLMGGANYYPKHSKHFLKIHQIKYDEFLKVQNSDLKELNDYIVYIGSAPSSHPAYANRKNTLNHNKYIKKLVSYLDRVELETGLKVVVSAHPKGLYNQADFGAHTIYNGYTSNLIHHSRGVICHFSTSLVNAVLEYKPIQIIYDNDMLRSSFGTTLIMGLELGRLCHANICNINAPVQWNMSVDKDAYDCFLNREIICADMKDKSNAEIICAHLEDIFNIHYND